MEVVSSSGYNRQRNQDDYTNVDEILADIDYVTHENFILSQTVEVLERYLRKRSPTLLIGMEKFLESYSTRCSFQIPQLFRTESIGSSRSSPSPVETINRGSSTTSTLRAAGRSNAHSSLGMPKISPAARADIVERELEENRMVMDKLQRKFESATFLLQTEEENLRWDIWMLKKDKADFENFVSQSTDPKTGKVYHDKLLRFLQQELKNTDRHLRNIKLNSKSLHTEYKRLQNQQQKRMELRERLHFIDIDKLIIENREQLDFLEERNDKLENLKKIVGKKGQALVYEKSKLVDTVDSLKDLKYDFKIKEAKCVYAEDQERKYNNLLVIAEQVNQNIKDLNTTFKSPEVHSYLQIISTLEEIRLEKEMWERRCKYQAQQISLLEHQVKQLCPLTPRSRGYTRRGRSTAFSISEVIRFGSNSTKKSLRSAKDQSL